MTWDDFHRRFNALFAAGDWADESVATWIRDVYVPCGIEPEELALAAAELARGDAPARPYDVLRGLLAAVRERRVRLLEAQEDQSRRGSPDVTPAGPCPDCDGSGWAVVPQQPQPPAAAAKDYLATWAVTCKCAAGLRLAAVAEDRRGRKALALARYEADAPGWRRERDWWRKHEAAKGRVGASTAGWDRLVQRLLQRAKGGGR